MPRDLPLSNGSLHVNFDARYQMRDVYFPHVGKENHTLGSINRLGIWADGRFAWLSDWQLDLRYQVDALVTQVTGRHEGLGLSITINDAVDCDVNLLMRRVTVRDERADASSGGDGSARAVRLFAHIDPNIGESAIANCAYFDGVHQAMVCYKADRYFLLGSNPAPNGYAAGIKGTSQYEGSWRDAEDGALSDNAVASGFVDATISLEMAVPSGGEATAHIWLAAGRSLNDVAQLHTLARKAPDALIERTARYWRFWLGMARREFGDLSPEAADLYRRSLLLIRANIDNGGAITAANDSDITSFGRDHYSYVWPRDAALVALTLDQAGYHEAPRQFFAFLRRVLTQTLYDFSGYLLHRYTPDGLIASSWHPMVGQGRLQLPIQEDGTALVVHSLCKHLSLTRDVELAHDLYWEFVRPAADFLMLFRDHNTGLPHASHDLWEEQHGVFLFTCSTVYAALEAAADLTETLGDAETARQYRVGAAEIRQGVSQHFYDPETQRFAFMLHVEPDGALRRDMRLDSSMAGVFAFGMLPAGDPRVVNTMRALQHNLQNHLPMGGIARHTDDYYHHINGNYAECPGNPWFISALWLADWLIDIGDRVAAREWLEWCVRHALPSGVMAEQIHPHTGAPLSVSPLTWSHAAFVATVERYMSHTPVRRRMLNATQPWRDSRHDVPGTARTSARTV